MFIISKRANTKIYYVFYMIFSYLLIYCLLKKSGEKYYVENIG